MSSAGPAGPEGDRAACPLCGSLWDLRFAGEAFAYTGSYPVQRMHHDPRIGRLKVASLRRWLSVLDVEPRPHAVCDVGFGGGFCLADLRARARDVVGIEAVAENLAHARELGLPASRLFLFDERPAVLMDVLEHTDDPEGMLVNARRVLNRDGWLLLGTPDASSLSARLMGAGWPLFIPAHRVCFSRAGLVRLLERTGFAAHKVWASRRATSLGHLAAHLRHDPRPVLFGLGWLLGKALPGPIAARAERFARAARRFPAWQAPRWPASPRTAFACLMLASRGVRLLLLVGGIRGSDACAYAHHAWRMLRGSYDPLTLGGDYYAYRYALLLPTALAFAIFGPTDLAATILPLAASLGTAALIYRLGRDLWDPQAGLLAMALWATFPLSIVFASLVSPDSFIPFYATLGVWTFLRAERASVSWWAAGLWYVGAGLAVGLAILTRLTSVLVLSALLAGVLWQPRGLPRRIPLLIGLAIPLGLAGGYLALATGDAPFEVHQIAPLSRWLSQESRSEDLLFYLKAFLGLTRAGMAWYAGVPVVAAAGLWCGWRRRDRGVALLSRWAIPTLTYLSLGSMSVTEYIPILKSYNYISLAAPALILLAAYALRQGVEPRGPRRSAMDCGVRVFVLVVLLVAGLYGASRIIRNIHNDSAPYLAAAALRRLPADTVYLPRVRWGLFLACHLGYPAGAPAYVPLDSVRSPGDIAHGYVIVHDRYLILDEAGLSLPPERQAPAFLREPPHDWQVLVDHRGTPANNRMVLYRVGRPEPAR